MKKEKKGKKIRFDLACGNNRQKGFKGVDITKEGTQADIEWDLLRFPWEFAKNNSVDQIFCSHFIEHLPHGTDGFNDPMFQFMDEIWRILKPGGTATFVAPYYTSVRAFQDPGHQRFINEQMFLYFTKDWRKMNKLEFYPVKCDFKVVSMNHAVSEEFTGRATEAVQYAGLHFWNTINDIIVTLQKPK